MYFPCVIKRVFCEAFGALPTRKMRNGTLLFDLHVFDVEWSWGSFPVFTNCFTYSVNCVFVPISSPVLWHPHNVVPVISWVTQGPDVPYPSPHKSACSSLNERLGFIPLCLYLSALAETRLFAPSALLSRYYLLTLTSADLKWSGTIHTELLKSVWLWIPGLT